MKNDVKKKRKKFKFSRLFRNNHFVLIISLIITLVLWININLSDNNESTTTIVNIPVQVSLSDEAINGGLEIFSGTEQYASVTVTGNRVALGNLSNEDIIISAQGTENITTSGTYPLSLTARKANTSDNFEITSSVSPSVITIYVDHADEKEYELENKIVYKVAKGYHAGVSLSTDSITIQGPESEVSKIKSVAIEGNVNGELKEDREINCEVKLYDYSDKIYYNNMLSLSTEHVTAVFNVEPEKEIPLEVKFKNKPVDLNVDDYLTIEPSSILIAGPQNVLNKVNTIKTEAIDFSTLENKKTTLELNLEIPKKCTNLSETPKASVTLDFSKFKAKTLTVSSFSVKKLSDEYYCDVTTDSLSVEILAPRGLLKNVNESDISCVIDASGVDGITGSISLPVDIVVKNNNYCWVYGTYSANIYVTKK